MRYARTSLFLFLGAALSVSAGCDAMGVVADVIAGPQRIDAVYDLPKVKTVVLVDDPRDLLTSNDLPNRIAGRIGDDLTREKKVSQVIGPQVLSDLAAKNPDFGGWALDKVGRQVGADQVIYVVVQSFTLAQNNEMYEPKAAVTVKVLDVGSSKRLFPLNNPDGRAVVASERPESRDGASPATDAIIARRLADNLAERVGQLFYDHRMPDVGEKLPG